MGQISWKVLIFVFLSQAMIAQSQAIFGGGCFWCVEACFLAVKGVTAVKSGYAGGKNPNPTYQEICTGTTGHAEVIRVDFEAPCDYNTLLKAFFKSHDPTQLNRQGNDVGTQYRSVIFYLNEEQKNQSLAMVEQLNKEVFNNKIVTEISPAPEFYPCESYHDNYFALNPGQGYCQAVVGPKLRKFLKEFKP